ncbi:hypothetical protein [Bacillus sp. EAC]|uniref:hypothetical protein n=1 Tax=Bacillus sp. EAC TaxID=1978338 RepID=UPI0015C5122B|nr:hypothetical protein [Bacillus sp. EAC]
MFGILLGKEHVLEIESLILKSLNELENELATDNLNGRLKTELLNKRTILKEVYIRLPL